MPWKTVTMIALLLILTCACTDPKVDVSPRAETEADHVLLVVNSSSEDSVLIGSYYREKRSIPKENVVILSCSSADNIPNSDYSKSIEGPIRTATKASKHRIDYIVLTKGVPLRINDDGGYSVDAFLGAMNLSIKPIDGPKEEAVKRSLNPYFQHDEPFDSQKFGGLFLVTRLDGPTVEDAKRLVDNSLAAKPEKGPFFFDQAGNRNGGGYEVLNKALGAADEELRKRGFQAALEATDAFVAPDEKLMGYCSWGSNDGKFDDTTYKKLKFKPGAIAETFVSTSGRTFSHATSGQSQITDLIAQGVTGVKGYVSEPYTFALARPEILFDRYTKGYNLAESFYMASLVVKWKDVVVGDPLCRPYRAK